MISSSEGMLQRRSPKISLWVRIFLFTGMILLCFFQRGFGKEKGLLLWENGIGHYAVYRIPSLLVTKKGSLLAFAEGRSSKHDSGKIDLLLRRSEDEGKRWSEPMVVWSDESNTCGNPCPVVDAATGRIWLFMTWNKGSDNESAIIRKQSDFPRLPYCCFSDDDGKSWSKPAVPSGDVRDSDWGWYATGPGIGICLTGGNFKGRLVIPCNHSFGSPSGNMAGGPFEYGAHVLYSDDHGENWHRSTAVTPGCNEC
ncbi:MAG: glycoside hydrolase, partial [Marinilabiliales bacterium]|nr:glycoside hydrolase [Marinilabiliales bacterium]